MAMTEKQKLFAEEYLKDLNGSRAYKAAYPNVKKDGAARSRASELLKRKEIKSYIDQKLEEMHNENTATAEEILEYLTSVVRGNSRSAAIVDGQIVNSPPREKEKLEAARQLSKILGLDVQRLEVKDMTKKTEAISNIEMLLKQMNEIKDDDVSE